MRWNFVFNDFLFADLDIELIPGQHVPDDTDLSLVGENATAIRSRTQIYDSDDEEVFDFRSLNNVYLA